MMVMVMLMFTTLVMLVIMVVMTANGTLLFSFLFHQLMQMMLERRNLLQSLQKRMDIEPVGRCGYDSSIGIMFAYQREGFGKLRLGGFIGVAEQNTLCMLDLIVEKLAKVLHVHFALVDVNHDNCAIQNSVLKISVYNGTRHVAQLANTRRLDQNTVGLIVMYDLL